MSENNKTIADIIAEKRELAERLRLGTPTPYEIEAAANLEFDANRIEAAWKREKAEIEASALAAGGIVEASRHKRGGNAAAMREALEKCVDLILRFGNAELVETPLEVIIDIEAILKAALSAPPKNCDVGSAEEQAERYGRYCDKFTRDGMHCENCPCCGKIPFGKCEFAWSQMPYEAEEGGAE